MTLSVPLPSGDQLVPSHFAIRLAAAPPAIVKSPATYSAGPVPSSNTVTARATPPCNPLPSADQLAPFHLATPFAGTPPALSNQPTAWRAGPLPSSNTSKPSTRSSMPAPSADQVAPSHFATRFAATPPAVVKFPPA